MLKDTGLLHMVFREGRAEKAAQLHTVAAREVDGRRIWEAMQDRFLDNVGGDNWSSRGQGGVWHRVHVRPRRSLFTPFKVAKGPDPKLELSTVRFTKGVTESGRSFEFHDSWKHTQNAHRILHKPWVGFTVFVEREKVSLSSAQARVDRGGEIAAFLKLADPVRKAPGAPGSKSAAAKRWSDIVDN